MASLDSLVLQEEEFLKNMVARIVALKPNLVLVEKTVSRLAQDMLFATGIALIINISSVRLVFVVFFITISSLLAQRVAVLPQGPIPY